MRDGFVGNFRANKSAKNRGMCPQKKNTRLTRALAERSVSKTNSKVIYNKV